jgi:hypothetical protein
MLEMGIALEEYHFKGYSQSHQFHMGLQANQLAYPY